MTLSGARPVNPDLHRGHIIVLNILVFKSVVVVRANRKRGLPALGSLVEVTILVQPSVTAQTLDLDRRDIIALGPMRNQILGRVFSNRKLLLPAVEVPSAEQGHCARSTMAALVNTTLAVRRLLPQALILITVVAENLPGPHALSALHAAAAPLFSHPRIAFCAVLALLLRRRLRGESTLMIHASAAYHLPVLNSFTALCAAFFPGVRNPVSPVGTEALLDCVLWRQGGQLIVLSASESFLAHQSALRLRTLLWASAVPGAFWRVAHVLARHVAIAIQRTRWLCTSGTALRRRATLSLSFGARILRTESCAVRRVAVNLTLGVVRLRTSGLALRLLAVRAAILVAYRLRAIPCAVRKARLSFGTVHVELGCVHHSCVRSGRRRHGASIFGNRAGCRSWELLSCRFTYFLQTVLLVVSPMVLVVLVMGGICLRLNEIHCWCLSGARRQCVCELRRLRVEIPDLRFGLDWHPDGTCPRAKASSDAANQKERCFHAVVRQAAKRLNDLRLRRQWRHGGTTTADGSTT
mmetsp:Transcript_37883/g.99212  ORF Transcript_37883/g.99212 Transcript_37883/m.99212 type:complete len:524 (-) Transcript_37883:13-1584(-)